jgi:hypothetical protein
VMRLNQRKRIRRRQEFQCKVKVKLSLAVIKACRGNAALILNDSTIKEWLVSSPGRFISLKRGAGTRRIGGWLGWGVDLDVWKKRTITCTCRESNPEYASCCLATTPTALMLLPLMQ